jgi:hypothetical protein
MRWPNGIGGLFPSLPAAKPTQNRSPAALAQLFLQKLFLTNQTPSKIPAHTVKKYTAFLVIVNFINHQRLV